jgi:hypothetical protein
MATMSFKGDIMPIFQASCDRLVMGTAGCHNDPKNAMAGVAGGSRPYLGTAIDGGAETPADIMMVYMGLFKPSFEYIKPHMNYVAPRDPTMSYLMLKMDPKVNMYDPHCVGGDFVDVCGLQMPSDTGIPLDQATRDKVRAWIAQGAVNN